MFGYSFLAMTAYNIIQPLTRSKFISSLGAANLPYVILVSGFVIGILMLGYTRFYSALPRRWALPITQGGMCVVMFAFWALFRTKQEWVSVAFKISGLILGTLLISHFWTLANGIYHPRQAKRLFDFIGGGVTLGGMTTYWMSRLLPRKALREVSPRHLHWVREWGSISLLLAWAPVMTSNLVTP